MKFLVTSYFCFESESESVTDLLAVQQGRGCDTSPHVKYLIEYHPLFFLGYVISAKWNPKCHTRYLYYLQQKQKLELICYSVSAIKESHS